MAREVGLEDQHLAPDVADPLGGLFGRLRVSHVVDRHPRTALGEAHRDPPTNAA